MSHGDFGTIIQIGDILVSEDVVSGYFACDYAKCKGACCIHGDAGAPLEEGETEKIERAWPAFQPWVSETGKELVARTGFFEIDRDGDIVTPAGSEACAYCHFAEDGSVWCAIEKCFLAGKTKFRKPISCSLYPIRVTNLTGGGKALNLHRWDICADAYEKGKREGIRAYQFLKQPLTEAFGEEFYEALCAAAEYENNKVSLQNYDKRKRH